MTTLFVITRNKQFILGADSQESESCHVRTHTVKKIQEIGDYVYLECGDSAARAICNWVLIQLRRDSDANDLQDLLIEKRSKLLEGLDEGSKLEGSMLIFKKNFNGQVSDVYEFMVDTFSIIHYKPSELSGPVALGSGGRVALGVYKALCKYSGLEGKELVSETIKLTAEIDLWTNKHVQLKVLDIAGGEDE